MTEPTNVVPLRPRPAPKSRSARLTLTAKRIADLKPGVDTRGRPARSRLADASVPGLWLNCSAAGAKSFLVRGRIGSGRNAPVVDIRLGDAAVLPLHEARAEAAALLVRMRGGEDPRRNGERDITVDNLIDRFVERQESRGVATVGGIEHYLRRTVERFAATPAADVTKAEWAAAIAKIERASGPEAGRAARIYVKAMMRWADEAGLVENSPALRLQAPRLSKAAAAEKRARAQSRWTLRREDWPAFWKVTGTLGDGVFAGYLRALMLTGLRRSEASSSVWSDIGDDVWLIPGTRRKNGLDHVVPVGPLLRRVLEGLPGGGPGQLVFPGRGGPITGWSKRIEAVQEAMGQPVALHGLRRGYRTALTELGGDHDLAELMVGHARRGLAGTYDVSQRLEERRAMQYRLEAATADAVDGR